MLRTGGDFSADSEPLMLLIKQIGSLAANQIPTYFVLEILFTMVGLILFGLLIGSLQNFIQNPQDR